MVQEERNVLRFPNSSRMARLWATGILIGAFYVPLAFAQGGETEISKTKSSNPPPVAAPVASAPAPAPAPAAAAAPAQKPSSPMGANPAWQAKPQQATATPAAPPPMLAETDQALVLKVNDYFNALTDLQGDFTQTEPDNKQKHGRFYFQRPGKARFDYAPPSGLRVISDGNNLVIEDQSLNTSEKYPLEITPFKILLAEKVDIAKDARVVSVEQGPDLFIVTVEEKDNPGTGHIRMFFNKANSTLKEWIVTDAQGLDTRIEVSNLETGKRLSDNFFIISAFTEPDNSNN
jgi:outer membrane lipoprotein-sorting protein